MDTKELLHKLNYNEITKPKKLKSITVVVIIIDTYGVNIFKICCSHTYVTIDLQRHNAF